jgi:putative ABC transport system permease protein
LLFWALIIESIRFAWHSLTANKLRTFLSLLGITIGIFSIITVFTVVDSLESNVRKSVASLGDNVIFIQKWPWEFGGDYPWWKYLNRPVPTIEELPEVLKRSTLASTGAFVASTNKTVKYRNNNIENVDLKCVSHQYDEVKTFELIDGRYFTEQESAGGRNKAIIGYDIAMNLFGNTAGVGKSISVLGKKFDVIGVFEKEGSSAIGNSMDNVVLIPINFARNLLDLRSERLDPTIYLKAKAGVSNEALKDEATGIMRNVRKLKPMADANFALNETSMLTKGFDSVFLVIGLAGWVIGGFSIIVGGFGIANIMFVSVKERTALIGIQKSLGAKNIFILTQFLTEAVILSLFGGIIGLLFVLGGLLTVNYFLDLGIALTSSNIILALTISILIGVISGFIPSYTASQLDPVEAMRS